MENYTIVMQIGSGNFGTVKKVLRKNDQKRFAMKQLEMINTTNNTMESIKAEEAVLKEIDHPSIVKLIDSFECETDNSLYYCLVMEYCDGGDLSHVIAQQKSLGKPFRQEEIIDAFMQVTLSLKVIHDKSIIHRDIKPQNIFLSKNGNLKLGDFGLVKKLAQDESRASASSAGTPMYMAPEILREERISTAADMWSLGCVLYELMELKPAFDCGTDVPEMFRRIKSGQYHEITSSFSTHRQMNNIICSLLSVNERERPRAAEVLQQEILQEPLANLNNEMDKYAVVEQIGRGNVGLVNLVQRKLDHKLFAMKLVEVFNRTITAPKFNKEEAILMNIDHASIVKLIESFENDTGHSLYYCVVMEYCDAGSLSHLIREHADQKKHFREEDIIDMFVQITIALKEIHNMEIVHRDVKPQSIFLMKNGTLKLGDFWLMKQIEMDLSRASATQSGTQIYMAPEVLQNERITTSADIWSLGCVLYELMELKPAFDCGTNTAEMFSRIKTGLFHEITCSVPNHLIHMLNCLLSVDESQRLSATEILEQEVFKEAMRSPINKPVLNDGMTKIQMVNEDIPTEPDITNSTTDSMDVYTVKRVIGKGAFGVVKLVERHSDKRTYVMKEMRTIEKSSQLRKEEEALKVIRNIHVVQIIDTFNYETKLDRNSFYCILMEFCSGGDLKQLIAEKGQTLSCDTIRSYFQQLCSAVVAIHDLNLIHRDIKPQNIFVAPNGTLKLGDFGLAKVLHFVDHRTKAGVIAPGTLQYSAPEVISGLHYANAADIWSLGCVIYELIELKPAFECGKNVLLLTESIMAGKYGAIERTTIGQDVVDSIKRMLAVNARARPKASDIIPSLWVCRFAYYGMTPLTANMDGKYPIIKLEELQSAVDIRFDWTEMVNGEETSILHFPPLVVSNGVAAIIFCTRHARDLLFFGGYHSAVSRNAAPVIVNIQLKMVIIKNNGEALKVEREVLATLKHGLASGEFAFLLNISGIPWKQVSCTLLPTATLFLIRQTDLTMSKFVDNGMSPMTPNEEGDYPRIEWALLKAAINHMSIWKEIVTGYANTRKRLHFPPLIVTEKIVAVLFCMRRGDDLQFSGGFHVVLSPDTVPLKVTLMIKIVLRKVDGNEIEFEKEVFATLEHGTAIEEYSKLLTMPEIPWQQLSSTHLPIATLVRLKLTRSIESQFMENGMYPLTPNEEGIYQSIDWGRLRASMNYMAIWCEIVKGNEDLFLDIPPLIVSEDIAAIMFCRRLENDFQFIGGFHSAVLRGKAPLIVTLQMKMVFFRNDGEKLEVEKELFVTFKHGTDEGDYPVLLTISNIPWKLVSQISSPLITLLRLKPTNTALARFSFNGLVPLTPNDEGRYARIDWGELQGSVNCMSQWSEAVKGNENAILPFPPLTLHEEVVAVISCTRRRANELQFFGGFHSAVSPDEPPMTVTVHINMILFTNDGKQKENVKEASFTLKHGVAGAYARLFNMQNIPWQQLSWYRSPITTLTFKRLKKSHVSKFENKGMSPLTANDEGEYPRIEWENLLTPVNYAAEWNEMVKGNEITRLDLPPLIVMEDIVAIFFCMRNGNDLEICGGFHSEVPQDAVPLNVTLQIKIFLEVDGEAKELERNVFATLRHKGENGRVPLLLTMSDIPWQKLSLTTSTIHMFICIRKMNTSMSRFLYNSMLPLTPDDEGKYPPIEWEKLNAAINYMAIWNDIVIGSENAFVHVPPLILLPEVAAVMFCDRCGNDLQFYGGFHTAVSRQRAAFIVIMYVKMTFVKISGENHEVEETVIATLDHRSSDGKYDHLLTMSDIPWQQLPWTRALTLTLITIKPLCMREKFNVLNEVEQPTTSDI